MSLIAIGAKGITPAADFARVGMLTFQIGSVTVQARGSQAVVMAVKSGIAGTAVEICRLGRGHGRPEGGNGNEGNHDANGSDQPGSPKSDEDGVDPTS